MTTRAPDLETETRLAALHGPWVAGCDEVGRGSLAGPVTVGLVVVDPSSSELLPGVRDSKLLRSGARVDLVDAIKDWAAAWGVGHATPQEIDTLGILPATGLAGRRALDAAARNRRPDVVLVDGNYDWLTPGRQASLFEEERAGADRPGGGADRLPPVTTQVKADLTCLSVAAASILAKVDRDQLMCRRHESEPHFGWESNKGYGTQHHRDAIRTHGPSDHHRRSWKLI
ncbi:ribonuclease HII [Zhihengliuella salsuginis]|uniref:Ribonuclease n=1 Tax=Zhihengliuella salsuginis TaxID=578222 RepID=A0ABQ3GM39_9MICC|nr:ribonuclease HII [Zhihengliuella salsuginis]GHD11895.1 ribonuclease [Zhihengliuella salsuginis]